MPSGTAKDYKSVLQLSSEKFFENWESTISFWKPKINAVWCAVTVTVTFKKSEKIIPSIASYQHTPTLTTATTTQALWPDSILLPKGGFLLPWLLASFVHAFAFVQPNCELCMDTFQVGQAGPTCDVVPGWRSQIWWYTKGHVESCWNFKYLLISRLSVLFNKYFPK